VFNIKTQGPRNIVLTKNILSKTLVDGLQIVTLERPECTSYYISLQGWDIGEFETSCRRLARVIREYEASPVSLDVFGVPGNALPLLQQAFGEVQCPVTWLESRKEHAAPFYGVLARAVAGPEVVPVRVENRVVGMAFNADGLRYCRLGGILPKACSRSREEQTRTVFELMERALREVDMNFSHVARTWFYNRDMLEWYDVFNEVRTAFFTERNLFDTFVPASTGIGCWNGTEAALTGGLIAVAGRENNVALAEVPSPLQRSSLEYGSAFSRAVELGAGGLRRLFVSGTASIEPSGQSVHIGDVRAQIQLTLDVVQAILESRGMNWNSVSRSIAYFKHAEDSGVLAQCMKERNMPSLPGILAHTDICRDDLLFELEVDAMGVQ